MVVDFAVFHSGTRSGGDGVSRARSTGSCLPQVASIAVEEAVRAQLGCSGAISPPRVVGTASWTNRRALAGRVLVGRPRVVHRLTPATGHSTMARRCLGDLCTELVLAPVIRYSCAIAYAATRSSTPRDDVLDGRGLGLSTGVGRRPTALATEHRPACTPAQVVLNENALRTPSW